MLVLFGIFGVFGLFGAASFVGLLSPVRLTMFSGGRSMFLAVASGAHCQPQACFRI